MNKSLNYIKTYKQLCEEFPRECDVMESKFWELVRVGMVREIGSDLADWLSANARVKLDVAKRFVKLFKYC